MKVTDEYGLALGMNDYPSLNSLGGGAGGTVGSGVGSVGQGAGGSSGYGGQMQSEFTMHSEDFPALPGVNAATGGYKRTWGDTPLRSHWRPDVPAPFWPMRGRRGAWTQLKPGMS